MLKHVAKIDKNIKTHFISSNKYFITYQYSVNSYVID